MEYEKLRRELIKFRDERDWKQFHTVKSLQSSIAIEAGELLETTQWMRDSEIEEKLDDKIFVGQVSDEAADIFCYLIYLCEELNIDLIQETLNKINMNKKRYTIAASFGISDKMPR